MDNRCGFYAYRGSEVDRIYINAMKQLGLNGWVLDFSDDGYLEQFDNLTIRKHPRLVQTGLTPKEFYHGLDTVIREHCPDGATLISSPFVEVLVPLLPELRSMNKYPDWCFSKTKMYQWLGSCGIRHPEIYWSGQDGEFPDKPVQYPCVGKPNTGTGGTGVYRINNLDELFEFFRPGDIPIWANWGRPRSSHYAYNSENQGYLVQEYIEGDTKCCAVLVDFDRKIDVLFSYGNSNLQDKNFVTEIGFLWPYTPPEIVQDIFEKMVKHGLPSGIWMMDYKIVHGDVWVMEISPRPPYNSIILSNILDGGELVKKSIHMDLSLPYQYRSPGNTGRCIGKQYVVLTPGGIDHIEYPERGELTMRVNVGDVIRQPRTIDAIEMQGEILVDGKTQQEVTDKIDQILSQIRINHK